MTATLDSIFGTSQPAPSATQVRSNSLDAIFGKPTPIATPPQNTAKLDSIFKPSSVRPADEHFQITKNTPNPISSVFHGTEDIVKRASDNYASTIQPSVDKLKGDIANPETNPLNPDTNIFKATSHGFALAGHAVQDIWAPVASVIKAITDKISDSPEIQKIAQANGVGAALDTISSGGTKYSDWAKSNPHASSYLEGTVQSALNGLGALDSTNVIPTMDELTSGVKSVANSATEGAGAIINKANEVGDIGASKIADTKNALLNKAKTSVQGKPEADILSTPEAEVYKLSPSERKIYFDSQKAGIEAKSDLASQQIKENLQTRITNTDAETENLNRELSTASRDEVVNIRPKIISAMGEQSSIYRKLVDEEIDKTGNLIVSPKEINDFVNAKYGDSPAQAKAIIDRLGVGEAKVNTSVRKIYNQTKELKQDIGSSAKSGTRTYTPDEKLTDDAISTLSSFLKSKGVDLTEANKFWSKYAPIRNQLVREAKPFIQSGTQTKTFANTLTRVARGTDINNENFINEVENLLDEPLAKTQKEIVSKLNANEKEIVTAKIESESKKIEVELAKEKELKGLNSKQIEVERQAKMRDYTRKVLKYVTLTVLGGEAIKHVLP